MSNRELYQRMVSVVHTILASLHDPKTTSPAMRSLRVNEVWADLKALEAKLGEDKRGSAEERRKLREAVSLAVASLNLRPPSIQRDEALHTLRQMMMQTLGGDGAQN